MLGLWHSENLWRLYSCQIYVQINCQTCVPVPRVWCSCLVNSETATNSIFCQIPITKCTICLILFISMCLYMHIHVKWQYTNTMPAVRMTSPEIFTDRFCGRVNFWAPQFYEVVDINPAGSGAPEVWNNSHRRLSVCLSISFLCPCVCLSNHCPLPFLRSMPSSMIHICLLESLLNHGNVILLSRKHICD